MSEGAGPYVSPIVALYRRPHNHGALEGATHEREGDNPLCGDRIRLQLRVEDARVTAARFTANACALCTASASLLTDRLQGLALRDAAALGEADALLAIGAAVPAARVKCVTLPYETLHAALAAPSGG
ncbi:MAG: system FeS assembly protein NifU family [Gemmatimonadetes bacterium]|nr:system FeS assembly protein NifU family [Gemmatimonadota bacterium]